MEFTLNINLDNAAYQDDYMAEELSSNLEFIVGAILSNKTDGIVRDSNGNKTGSWSIK